MDSWIYIVLSRTGTAFAKAAERITGEKYNHASVSFDYELKESYSFNMARDVGGFHHEGIEEFEGAELLIYSLKLPKSKKAELKERLTYYSRKGVSYNFEGLFNALFRTSLFDESPNQICSQFVTNLLRDVGIDLFEGREASTIRPQDYVSNNLLSFVSAGHVKDGRYRPSNVKNPSSLL